MYNGNQSLEGHRKARSDMRAWKSKVESNIFEENIDFKHTLAMYFPADDLEKISEDLTQFGEIVPKELEQWVAINDHRLNYPAVENYNGIGEVDNKIIHHPALVESGSIIYKTGVVGKLTRLGGLKEGHALYFLGNHAGEAGHHCPLICSYETARLINKLTDFPNADEIVSKLLETDYRKAYTASQFLTEVQGGSDVGKNATIAWKDDEGNWRIKGEKWFTSNPNAEVNVITARYDQQQDGTKGLSIFLVPSRLPNGERNTYSFRRMKEKIGTRALASAEIDYHDALAYELGPVKYGFQTLMKEVIHHSRLALGVSVLGMGSSAYRIARHYADHRSAFGHKIGQYPLVQENLARMRVELLAGTAGLYHLIDIQDKIDLGFYEDNSKTLFVRLMSNISKHLLSRWMVDLCHHAIDGLGGNGAIESFSALPRLIRDVIVEENWEGSHNTLRVQILRDIHKFKLDEVYFEVLEQEVNLIEDEQYRNELGRLLNHLQDLLVDMKAYSHDLQTLKIQKCIELMGTTYYYLTLVREGLHLQKSRQDETKLHAAALFKSMHIDESNLPYDDNYLKLIQSIIRMDLSGVEENKEQEVSVTE